MKEKRITIIINRPLGEVYKFTTNPKNTHLWVPSIEEETSGEYPPRIGTQHKNRGKCSGWVYYKVMKFEKNKIFLLADLDENYTVRYAYRKMTENKTEMEYF